MLELFLSFFRLVHVFCIPQSRDGIFGLTRKREYTLVQWTGNCTSSSRHPQGTWEAAQRLDQTAIRHTDAPHLWLGCCCNLPKSTESNSQTIIIITAGQHFFSICSWCRRVRRWLSCTKPFPPRSPPPGLLYLSQGSGYHCSNASIASPSSGRPRVDRAAQTACAAPTSDRDGRIIKERRRPSSDPFALTRYRQSRIKRYILAAPAALSR